MFGGRKPVPDLKMIDPLLSCMLNRIGGPIHSTDEDPVDRRRGIEKSARSLRTAGRKTGPGIARLPQQFNAIDSYPCKSSIRPVILIGTMPVPLKFEPPSQGNSGRSILDAKIVRPA